MRGVDHASVQLLNSLGLKKLYVLRYFFVERALQHVTYFFYRPEWQVVLDVHICRVQLVSEVLSSLIKSIAHLLCLIDAFQKTLLTGGFGRKLHACFLHCGDRLLSCCDALRVVIHNDVMLIEPVHHLAHIVVEATNACLE